VATPEPFERELSASVGEWLRLLGGALAGRDWRVEGDGAHIMFDGGGTLVMGWRVGEPRRIALLRLPRLHVRFSFSGVPEAAREAFMRHLDLHTHRGGG